ncbi:zinc-binding alcohol dehydrogenase family protein [Parapedobacter tibetensis]|uniref:zinc-binding alcohol dehydrogenase family protein n=1 Tax=Parapedobacter tibetensis TaxID=2972951 RepID=UPI00214D9ED5|nr:zinc-binding alcohol dehydrogenase family protein [Parapedobacter tibetensis]
MKQLSCINPGTFSYIDTPMPLWKAGHTLLKIRQIGVCGTDIHAFEGTQPYFNYPRVLGHEVSAEIVETAAQGFRRGDRVTIVPYLSCGSCIACRNGKPNCCTDIKVCGVHVDGALSTHFLVPDAYLVAGNGFSDDELALVEPLAIGAHGVRRASISPGEYVLVVGAGPIGLGTMEMARIAGAEIIAMDVNPKRLEFCRDKLSIAHTIDGRDDKVLEQLSELTNGDMPTVIIDCTGNQYAINQSFSYLSHGGRYVLIGLQKNAILVNHPEFHKREATLMSSRNATVADFEHVLTCLREKRIVPDLYVTDKIPFEEIADFFPNLLDPQSKTIKAMITFS